MSFQDSAVIFFIALLLFGPKKLPELARQIGKLMGEFRRASNDFRMQMEDELRISEQAERSKQIAAIEAAAPASVAELPAAMSPVEELEPHPHERLPEPGPVNGIMEAQIAEHSIASETAPSPPDRHRQETSIPASSDPLPIATSGDLAMMPPTTGLPIGRDNASVAQAFDSIPQTSSVSAADVDTSSETAHHG